MLYKLLIVGLCIFSLNVSARQVISGKLTDKVTNEPVDAANVELLVLPDSTNVETAVSNSEGMFVLYKADTAKLYCLRVTRLSYKMAVFTVTPQKGSMINNVGVLNVEPSAFNIKEVVVMGSKVKVTELPDRTVYAIPSDFKKTSINGLDVLRKIPSMQVDYFTENLTVDGKTNIKIEVDGVTRDKEFIKKLHPSEVDKLEIITNPSGKYDAEVDAVINIITNPKMRYGVKGMVNTQILPYDKNSYMGRADVSFDYGKEKFSAYIAANGGLQDFGFTSEMHRTSASDANVLNRISNTSSKGFMGRINTGIIYDPNEYNNINFNISYSKSQNDNNGDNFNYSSYSDVMSQIYNTPLKSKTMDDGINTSLFYKHKFDKVKAHSIEMEVNYYKSLNSTNNSEFQNIYYTMDTTELFRGPFSYERNNTDKQTLSAQVNYSLPLDSLYAFNTGVNTNYNEYAVDNYSSNKASPNMDYEDLRIGGFAELSRNFKKGSLKVGTRAESSHVRINSSSNKNYISWLPYVNAQYRISSIQSLKLSYSRRVIRPSSSQLNPFESAIDTVTINKGNINLKPAYRDNFQLSYNLKLGRKKITVNLAPQVFMEYKTQLIQKITRKQDNSNIYESVYENISNGYETGVGMSVNSQLSMVMFNSNVRYSFNHVDSYLTQIDETNKRGWSWNSFAMCPLPKNFKVFAVMNVMGPMVNGQETTKSSPFYLLGIMKQFKNNSSVNVLVFNPFADKFFKNTTTVQNSSFYQKSEMYMNLKNAIMFTYSYNFKIGNNVNIQKRNVDQPTEDNMTKLPF